MSEKKIVMQIILPFPLPTWNRILQMSLWEKKSLRHTIHQLVYMCIQSGNDSVTRTVSAQKRLLMDSYLRGYYKMIRPSTSTPSRIPKSKAKPRKRS